MKRFVAILMLLSVLAILAGCTGNATPEPTEEIEIDPVSLLDQAITQLGSAKAFRMIVEQKGAPWYFAVTLDGGATSVAANLRRAEAQFIAPEVLFSTVNIRVAGLTVAMDIFARGIDQWIRPLGATWFNVDFAEGFDASQLLADTSGFQAALRELTSLEYAGETTLIDGSQTHHARGMASGNLVDELLFGLLQTDEDVIVDVYVDQTTSFPSLLEVTQPETGTDDEEPTKWVIEIYDVNEEPIYEDPTNNAEPS